MSLKKCKECKQEISKKAKVCPNCGSPNGPKHYSLGKSVFVFILLITILMIFAPDRSVVKKSNNQSSVKSSPSKTETKNTSSKKPVIKTKSWDFDTSKDEMSGDVSYYVSSKAIKPKKRMEFPYSSVGSWVAIGCKNGKKWAYFGFTSSPNLSGGTNGNGSTDYKYRIKWDDKLDTVTLNQQWGSDFLHTIYTKDFISKIKSNKKAKLELDWHGNGKVHFEYDLVGANNSIKRLESSCN